MSFFNRLTAVIVSCALLGPLTPVEARTKKGDKFLADGRLHEAKKEWDAALESYEKAQSEDPSEPLYQVAADKGRSQAAQAHVEKGLTIRAKGQLGEALIEFQKAYDIHPGSAIAGQELRETQLMIARERKRVEQTGKEAAPEVRALTPGQMAEQDEVNKIERMLPIPELRPMMPGLVYLKMPAAKVKVIFETLGKYAGINVLWDPDYVPPTAPHDTFTVDFDNSTLDQALDYIAVLSKSYWKALSPNTIFVTNDNPTKRRDYEEQVMKTFYLHNVGTTQELQEVVNAVRTVPELVKVFPDTAQYAIIVRGEADKVALAEKIVHDLDKPRPEVLLDILILEASTTFSKQITAAVASTGLNVPFNFTPRSSIQVQGTSPTGAAGSTGVTGTTGSTDTSTSTGAGTTPSSTTGSFIPLSQLGHLASSDFSTTIPGALLQAAMSDAKTTVLQAPEMRAVDNVKSILNIGQRQPTATGSFQPGIGGVGINPLVNTQFQYIDIGVNVEVTARVHSDSEVSMHLLLNLTTLAGNVDLGGITQPIIGQRKIEHELRMKEGEVAIIGGLVTRQDDKTITGIPGLSSIPLLGNLFKGSNVDHNRDDVIIVVIPHIIRKPEFTEENLRAIAVGNTQTVKINYAPKPADPAAPAPASPVGEAATPTATTQVATGAPSLEPVGIPAAALPAGVRGGPAVPANAPSIGAPPATAPPMTAPPATAPPATAPPATAPPATAPPATAPAATVPAATLPAATTVLRFAPSPVQIGVGGTFSVSLMVDNASDVAGAPVQVVFDPKVVKLNDITQGDLLSQGGIAATFTKNIQNDAGGAAVQLNRPAGSAGANGNGTLLTLNFSALSAGTTQITAPNVTLRNSQGAPSATGSPQLTVNVK
jgi:general secretion pathway protein D